MQVVCTLSHFSNIWLFVTPWTAARQASLSMHSPGKNTGVGCHFLLQGIFPTQGSNWHLLHCRRILYHWATREAWWKSRYLYKSMNFPILTLQPDKDSVFKLTYMMKTLWHNYYFLQNRTTELNASTLKILFICTDSKLLFMVSPKEKQTVLFVVILLHIFPIFI